jgi:hypothetical protein
LLDFKTTTTEPLLLLLKPNLRMKTGPHTPGKGAIPTSGDQLPTLPLEIIRTETVLSKLPVHNLAKTGRVDIQILRKSPNGQIELKWEVSYSDRYGQARQLAYKLDTIVIDRAIEAAGKPLPERLKLGSLREISEQLGISEGGRDLQFLKRAFHQNAGAYIVAKFRYRANDGSEKLLEAGFHRYGVFFTGDSFKDGVKADAVYIEFQPSFREVLNNASFRPLDLNYKKQLLPAAQRFYEIVSYKVFAALKYNQPMAQLAYSEYCTFSAQQRYFDYDHFKKQMYKVHRPHIASGYIAKLHFNETTDDQGKKDWTMCYVPGPKALAEYAIFTGKKPRIPEAHRQRQQRLNLEPAAEPVDDRILAELASRGVGESDARQLLAGLQPGQAVFDQLEWGDFQIAQAKGKITNPPGFYISLLQRNVPVPTTFETSRARKARLDADSAQRKAVRLEREAVAAAEEAENSALDGQIQALSERARGALMEQARAALLADHPRPEFLANYLKTHPDAEEREGIVWVRARRMLKEGWLPPVRPAIELEPAGDIPLDS